MPGFARFALVLLLSACLTGAANAQPNRGAPAPVTDEDVQRAIDEAIEYLWAEYNEQTCWDDPRPGSPDDHENGANYGGRTALRVYALLAAGVSPQEPRIQNALRWLSRINMRGTYGMAMRANAYAEADPQRYRQQLQQDVRDIVRGVNQNQAPDHAHGLGAYTYELGNGTDRGNHWDNSNSQMAVLGVWAGARHGVEVPELYWRLVEQHWLSSQQRAGGWGYMRHHANQPRGSLTVAGIATLFITFDALHRDDFVQCRGQYNHDAIDRGLAWMAQNFDPGENPGEGGSQWYYYYLYGIERVALAGGYKYFGSHDWYAECTPHLLDRLQRDRNAPHHGNNVSFALLFLARGQHPVMVNHLRYEGDWQNRPRALANLTRWITRTFEKTVNWQIVNLDVEPEDWHDAPILYVSGSRQPSFSEADKEKLRRYVWEGGTLLSTVECNGRPFDVGMRELYADLFPQYELVELDREHPIFDYHFPIRRPYRVYGISNGVRLLAIHIDHDLPLAWQLDQTRTSEMDFNLAANLYFYVTDRGSLRNRGVSHWPEQTRPGAGEPIRVARLSHPGQCNPEPLGWTRMSMLMANEANRRLIVSEPMDPTALAEGEYDLAHLTSATGFDLSGEQIDALRAYCDNGGLLLVDAAGGGQAARDATEALVQRLFPDDRLSRLATTSEIYQPGGEAIGEVHYRGAARMPGQDDPRLRGVVRDGRILCVYSDDDISAGMVGYSFSDIAGYAPDADPDEDSVFKIVRGILEYAGR